MLLVATGLTGCSGSKSYCSTIGEDKSRLTTLSADIGKPGRAGADALRTTVTVLSDLRDEAPDDISDEWVTLVAALQGLVDAFRASGATPSDFAGGKKPDGVTAGQYDAVQQAVAELQGTRVQQAGKSIEQHAQDVCQVDLGPGGLGGLGG
ncbi:hypothetical protein BH10ACT10_BH10ACT10_27580 [soil metagenome]